MFEDTLELAENKLLVLYIIREVKLPVTKNIINEIILQNNFINYFTLQQYIAELLSSDFIKYTDEEKNHKILLTERGVKVLSLFEDRISKSKKISINDFLKRNIYNIKNDINVTADYTIENKNNFIVNLKAFENGTTLIDLKISVANNNQARTLCAKWKKDSSQIYNKIINSLIND